jgi:hypothetical protein
MIQKTELNKERANSFFNPKSNISKTKNNTEKTQITTEQFDLDVDLIYIEYKPSESLAATTFDSIVLTVEIVTKIYNKLFVNVDDSWVPDNKSGWEHLEDGLTIYKEIRIQIFEYLQHRDEILEMLNNMKNSLKNKEVFMNYFMNFEDEIKFIQKEDLDDPVQQEKMEVTKIKIMEFYDLIKIYEYIHTFDISKTEKFLEMEKHIDYEIIDYINSLNKILFTIHFIIAQDEILMQKSKFIIDHIDNQNYLAAFIHSTDAVIDLIDQTVRYKNDIGIFYRNLINYTTNVLLKGERFSQIITDQIILIRLNELI